MNKKAQMEASSILLIIGALVVITLLFCAWGISIVQYNEYAFEREFGKLYQDQKEIGFNWIGFGTLDRVNNQVRNYEMTVTAASKDMQDVGIILNLNLRLKEDQAYNFLLNYKDETTYMQYLNNKVQEKVKTVILKYNAGEILNNRLVISKECFDDISNIKELVYFEFNDLAIVNIKFSDEFSKSLERNAQVEIERQILVKQKDNLQLMKENMGILDIDTYFKYQLIEKWDGKASLLISDALLYNK